MTEFPAVDYAALKQQRMDTENRARDKAQKAALNLETALHAQPNAAGFSVEYDTAKLHYDRCIAELEEAINANGD